jgi:Protein of unknown function (DUF3108)
MTYFGKLAFLLLFSVALTPYLAMQPPHPQANPSGASVSAYPPVQIAPPPPNYRFPNGQSYVYGVEWHLFNAGTATVKMESAGAEQKVTATADSAGVVNVLYGVHDRFEARFNPRTFCSLTVVKHTEEGSRKRDTQIRFDNSRKKSILEEKNVKTGEVKHTENDIPSCVTDVVTGFYYLASLPLQAGNSYSFPVNDGGKTAEVLAKVEARERVKTPAGTFQTVRVAAEPVSGPLKGKAKIAVWFSDDSNHTPVQMRSKLGWGALIFRLQRIDSQ